jgi:hypothetical protein
LRAVVDVGVANATSAAIATRGERLSLARARYSRSHEGPGAFHVDFLQIVEIDAGGRITALIAFDNDALDAALAELDVRYLVGEAAAQAQTWSVIVAAHAAVSRHELPATTPGWTMVDHRPIGTFEAGNLAAFLSATWALAADINLYIEAVHRLSDRGAVITHAAHGTSHEGLDLEWHDINLVTVDGDLLGSCEIFDEADLDDALARFDELDRPAPLLENDATRAWAPVVDAFNRRDMEGLLALGNPDGRFEDRRKGLRDVVDGPGRRKSVHTMFETAPSGWRLEVEPIAIRGSHLSLTRGRYRDIDDADQPIAVELLHVTELGDDGLMQATVNFDPDDMDAAFEELDARYLAGEAATHAHTWSVIARGHAALNRGEMPVTTPDFEDIDRRRGASLAPGDLMEYLRAALDDSVGNRLHVVAIHRLTDLGAVFTHVARATSRQGFDAEWRITNVFTVEGDLVSRCEMFDEADIGAALARFDELDR